VARCQRNNLPSYGLTSWTNTGPDMDQMVGHLPAKARYDSMRQ
jgi:hypothetical protein